MLDQKEAYNFKEQAYNTALGMLMGGFFGGAQAWGNRAAAKNTGRQLAEQVVKTETEPNANVAKGSAKMTSDFEYTQSDINRIRKEGSTYRNLVAGIDSKISDFFSKWRDGRKSHLGEKIEKLYIGKMTEPQRVIIENILGYKIEARDFVITNDDVKHIYDHHGNAQAEINRGNLPLETISFDDLRDVLANPDAIKEGGLHKNGKTAVVFEKVKNDGTVVYVQFDNSCRKTLNGITLYIKKGSNPPAVNATNIANTFTSETTGAKLPSENSITQPNAKNNMQNAKFATLPLPNTAKSDLKPLPMPPKQNMQPLPMPNNELEARYNWPEGKPRPQLKSETEIRPANTQAAEVEAAQLEQKRLQRQVEALENGLQDDGTAKTQALGHDMESGYAVSSGAPLLDLDESASQMLARMERIAQNHPIKRATVSANPAIPDANAPDAETAIEVSNSLEGMRLALRGLRKSFGLTEADLVNAREIAAGRGAIRPIEPAKADKMESYVRLLRQYNDAMMPVYQYREEIKNARNTMADELVKNSDNWKDVSFGLELGVRTPERAIRKVCGEDADTIIEAYIMPVHEHEAQSTRWQKQMREQLRDAVKGTTHEDSVYAAMRNRIDYMQRAGMDASALEVSAQKYLQQHKGKIDLARVEALENSLIEITKQVHPEASEALIRNGYDPLEYTTRYLPSLPVQDTGKWHNKLFRSLGIETKSDELPSEIAGTTMNRRPGKQYAAFVNEREGLNTEFDAVKALDAYISNAADIIFHTDDIKNLRAFEERLRYRYSDEATKAELDAVDNQHNIDIEDRVQAKSELWKKSFGNMPHFPTWIAEYTDNLAGKKSIGDRDVEAKTNRGFYRTMNDIEGKVAINMTGFNINSALSNFIALMQGGGELKVSSIAHAIKDYSNSMMLGDTSFQDASDFLTNRNGSERVWSDGLTKVQNTAFVPMQVVDDFASNVLTRARYQENIKKGMPATKAMQEADAWAAGVMADRSKGAKPNIFNQKNPIIKAFTMFQIEVANQYGYLFEDLPRNLGEKGIAALAGVLLKIFMGAYLFNDAKEKLTGSRSALDPIGIVNDFTGQLTGYQLPNTIDLVREAASGNLDSEDFQTQKAKDTGEATLGLAEDVISELPFVSGVVGAAFGAGNNRLPIESAVPNAWNIIKSLGSKDAGRTKLQDVGSELMKPVYNVLLPVAGGQIKKTVEGLMTTAKGGYYQLNGDGEKELRFPSFANNAFDIAKTALFGKMASQEAQDYADNGFKGMGAKQTALYDSLRDDYGADPETVYHVMQELSKIEGVKDIEGNTLQSQSAARREALFANQELTPLQKQAIDRELISGNGEASKIDYTDQERFLISVYLPGKKVEAAEAKRDFGIDAQQFLPIADQLGEFQTEKDEDGTLLDSKNAQKRDAIMDMDVSPKAKAFLDRTFTGSDKPADYSNAEEYYLTTWTKQGSSSRLSDSMLAKARVGKKKTDISYQQFTKAYEAISKMKSDKDAFGISKENVSYKKKAYIDAMGLTKEQRVYLYDVFQVSKAARFGGLPLPNLPVLPKLPKLPTIKGLPMP